MLYIHAMLSLQNGEITHTVMEVNKTQDLQPASRCSVEPKWYGFKSKSKGMRTWTINGVSSSLSSSSKTSLPAWHQSGRERERERANFPLLSLFVLFSSSVDWIRPTHTLQGKGHDSVQQFKCSSHPETLSQTRPEIMFHQISGPLIAQSSWHTKLTITDYSTDEPWNHYAKWKKPDTKGYLLCDSI